MEYVQRVQEPIVAVRPVAPSSGGSDTASESNELDDGDARVRAGLRSPPFGLMLMFGAFGVPFPSVLSVVVAGSLAAQGEMSWIWVGAVALTSTVSGDLAGYGCREGPGPRILRAKRALFGLTPALRNRAKILFQKWSMLTVVLSRSLLSFDSSP